MDRKLQAFMAAERLINAVESSGIDLSNPERIIIDGYLYFPDYLSCEWGASRIVVWDDQCDYVIKIAREEKYERYNQREVEIYADAVKEDIADNFGWCACYSEPSTNEDGYVPGIYVMEFLDGSEEDVESDSWNYGYNTYCEENGLDKASKDSENEYQEYAYDNENGIVMEYLESQMCSPRDIAVFEIFINKWQITDLHVGNYLYRDNQLVICDYAGWGW